jgi:hypothetical protein
MPWKPHRAGGGGVAKILGLRGSERTVFGARQRQCPVQTGGLLRQWLGRPAGQGQRIHVAQLVSVAGPRRRGSFSRPYRTAHDPSADWRSAETLPGVEAKYAVAFCPLKVIRGHSSRSASRHDSNESRHNSSRDAHHRLVNSFRRYDHQTNKRNSHTGAEPK